MAIIYIYIYTYRVWGTQLTFQTIEALLEPHYIFSSNPSVAARFATNTELGVNKDSKSSSTHGDE